MSFTKVAAYTIVSLAAGLMAVAAPAFAAGNATGAQSTQATQSHMGTQGAQVTQAAASDDHASLNAEDRRYLKDTAQSDLEEIRYSPDVIRRTNSPAVKQFAERMIRDHTHNLDAERKLAVRLGVKLPTSLSKNMDATLAALSQERGKRFDNSYKHEMIRDHAIDIVQTRREISLGKNPLVKQFAYRTMRVLDTHLALARALPGTNPQLLPRNREAHRVVGSSAYSKVNGSTAEGRAMGANGNANGTDAGGNNTNSTNSGGNGKGSAPSAPGSGYTHIDTNPNANGPSGAKP